MADTPERPERKKPSKWILFAALLALAVFMYVSIAWKIVHYGP